MPFGLDAELGTGQERIDTVTMERNDPRQGPFRLFYTPGTKGKPVIRIISEDMVASFLKPNDGPVPNVLADFKLMPQHQGLPIAELESLYPYARK